jgi:hypothetical protein
MFRGKGGGVGLGDEDEDDRRGNPTARSTSVVLKKDCEEVEV